MPPDLCDLHVHTTASDGIYPPERVVAEAAAAGLSAVAVTDHDTIAGIEPALSAAGSVLVVPGLELGTIHRGAELHILGYWLDWRHPALNGELERLVAARARRTALMLERLRELGFPLTEAEVARQAGDAPPGRPHVAAALVAQGYVKDVDRAFRELLGQGRPAYVPRLRHSPEEAVDLIRAAGGAAVLAHPGLYPAAAAELLPRLVATGLAGVEAHYPAHDPGTEAWALEQCRRFGLVATGGSDFHGPSRHGDAALGSCGVPAAAVAGLRQRAGG